MVEARAAIVPKVAQRLGGGFAPLRVAGAEPGAVARCAKRARGLVADALVGAGDQDGLCIVILRDGRSGPA